MRTCVTHGIAGFIGISSFSLWRSEEWRHVRREEYREFSSFNMQLVFWVFFQCSIAALLSCEHTWTTARLAQSFLVTM